MKDEMSYYYLGLAVTCLLLSIALLTLMPTL